MFFGKLILEDYSVIFQGDELVRLVNVTRPKYLQSGSPVLSCQHSLRLPASSRIGMSSSTCEVHGKPVIHESLTQPHGNFRKGFDRAVQDRWCIAVVPDTVRDSCST